MIVMLNGVFDVLHVGHFNLLAYCRQLAGDGKVIVAIDEDDKVRADKGINRPVFDVHERAKALLDLRIGGQPIVDDVEFFHTDDELEAIIKSIMPEVIVKGSDWNGKHVVGSETAEVKFYDRIDEYSTTEIIKRCREAM
jgi:cytidyltransferase-like protein